MIYYILPILAVIIGALFVLIFRPKENKKLKLLLAFSGAFLLGITLFELLPSLFVNHSNGKSIGLFIVIGILIQICLEYFSKGAEHGHGRRGGREGGLQRAEFVQSQSDSVDVTAGIASAIHPLGRHIAQCSDQVNEEGQE